MKSTKNSMPPDLSKLVVVGDRVLVQLKEDSDRTKTGLFLPPGVKEREEVRSGYVMKAGPGYPIPIPTDEALEPWKEPEERVKYIPLQARVGDLAIFLVKGSFEVIYQDQKYHIVPQSSILMLEREDW